VAAPDVTIEDRGDHRRVALPGPHRVYGRRVAGGTTFETGYGRAALAQLLAVKGPEWLKDEIDRSEDPLYLQSAIVKLFGRYETFRGRRVLDFGCGCGATAVVLARLGARVVGVDPDGPSIGAARLRAPDAGVAITFAHAADDQRLPFGDGSFETVLAYQVLEHIPPAERRDRVRELWRVLALGGRLLVSAPNRRWPFESHTTRLWWVGWLPERLAVPYAVLRGRLSREAIRRPALAEGMRGVTYWDLLRWLPPREARVLNLERLDDLEAWLDVSLSRPQRRSRVWVKRAMFHAYRAVDGALWRRMGWPAAAFLPQLNVVVEKRRPIALP